MICPNCGREAQGKFCTACGTRLSQAPPTGNWEPSAGEPAGPDPGATSVIRPSDFGDPNATSAIRPSDLREVTDRDGARGPHIAGPADQTWSGGFPNWSDTQPAASGYQPTYSGGSTAVLSPPGSLSTLQGGYPVLVAFDMPPANKRFWAIPLIGFLAKAIVLIPHLIVLYALGIVVEVLQLVTWIPVLFTGQYPTWGKTMVGGTLCWNTRVLAFFYGLTDQYPPFGFDGSGYPVQVAFQVPPRSHRFWAIPIVGLVVKLIILIPHLIILYALGAVVGVLQLILWAFVLFGGKYPEWGYTLVGGYIRWTTRVAAFLFGLNDLYPPFQLAN